MSSNMQVLIYEGFLGSDPEMRYTPSGKAVTNFRIGSNTEYQNPAGEKVKTTTWLRITAWGKLGEVVNQYCGKGSHVIVTGRLTPGENGSPKVFTLANGDPAASFDVTAQSVRILKGKPVEGSAGSESPAPVEASDDENIPF